MYFLAIPTPVLMFHKPLPDPPMRGQHIAHMDLDSPVQVSDHLSHCHSFTDLHSLMTLASCLGVMRVTMSVMTPPMVGSTWSRVRSTLESDCLPALFQGTASFRLVVD